MHKSNMMCRWNQGSLYSLRNAALSRIISLLYQCLLWVRDKKVLFADTHHNPKFGVFSVHDVSPQAQFLNLLLCRCFQLSYLEKHPEEAQEDSAGSAPRRNPSLLNHGFPLSVSALVSFRRAPFRGLLPGLKVWTLPSCINVCDSWFALARTMFCATSLTRKQWRSQTHKKQQKCNSNLCFTQKQCLCCIVTTSSNMAFVVFFTLQQLMVPFQCTTEVNVFTLWDFSPLWQHEKFNGMHPLDCSCHQSCTSCSVPLVTPTLQSLLLNQLLNHFCSEI